MQVMTTETLEAHLEARTESQRLDFKRAGDWDVSRLAKDILAMSNVQYGGDLIIGVDDGTFHRTGVTPEQELTYVSDVMRDQMTRFADPHVQFDVAVVPDRSGLRYVVIQVRQFSEVPVICRVDDTKAGVKNGILYYRTLHRRPESAAVSNSFDMRTTLDLATIKMMQQRKAAGYTVEESAAEALTEELGGL